jgi:hypothetical protein
MIIALAGRRIDAPNAETPRFRPENVDLVRQRIRKLFEERDAKVLVSSAACGADLLALEEAAALGMRHRVILPYGRERFRETSVVDRPGDWGTVYDCVLNEIEPKGDLVTLRGNSEGTEAYANAGRAILEEAAWLGRELSEETLAALVWDGVPRGQDDLTKLFGDEAKAHGFAVVEIKTL